MAILAQFLRTRVTHWPITSKYHLSHMVAVVRIGQCVRNLAPSNALRACCQGLTQIECPPLAITFGSTFFSLFLQYYCCFLNVLDRITVYKCLEEFFLNILLIERRSKA